MSNDQGYLARIRDRVWFSPDGIQWSAVPDPTGIVATGAGPGGFVAVSGEPITAWWSPDKINVGKAEPS